MTDHLRRVATAADAEALRHLFETFAPRVKSYMTRQGAEATTAEDPAQETMHDAGLNCLIASIEKARLIQPLIGI